MLRIYFFEGGEHIMEKYRIFRVLILLSVLLVFNGALFGFGNKATHPAITERAVTSTTIDDYLKNNLGLSDGLQTELQYNTEQYNFLIRKRMYRGSFQPDITKRTAYDWIRAGSVIEDEDGYKYPIRPRHHFHDPLHNVGLNNKFDHPNYSYLSMSIRYEIGET